MQFLTLLSTSLALLGLASAAPVSTVPAGREEYVRGVSLNLKRDELLARDDNGADDGLNVGADNLLDLSGSDVPAVGELVDKGRRFSPRRCQGRCAYSSLDMRAPLLQ
ncbi:hypothetical protein BJX64DRAFT_271373 [Aspergillus heterothallicus]